MTYEERIEAMCRAVASEHYAARFDKPADDPLVLQNVEGNGQIFRAQMIIADAACIKALETPTREMAHAGLASGVMENGEWMVEAHHYERVWEAMFDAIPRGEPKS